MRRYPFGRYAIEPKSDQKRPCVLLQSAGFSECEEDVTRIIASADVSRPSQRSVGPPHRWNIRITPSSALPVCSGSLYPVPMKRCNLSGLALTIANTVQNTHRSSFPRRSYSAHPAHPSPSALRRGPLLLSGYSVTTVQLFSAAPVARPTWSA